jgi:hypothetical protein
VTARSSAALVLCCAEDGEVRLVDLIDTLHADGHSPEVLAGIDADPDVLTTAVDRLHGPALFVLCQTPELDRAAVRRLSGLFSARRGPEHHILTVDLSAGRTPTAVRDIERALDDVGVVRVGADDSEGERFRRDVVGPTAVDALGTRSFIPEPTVDPEELARELAAGLDAAAAMLQRRPAPRALPRRRTPVPRRPARGVYPGGGPLPAMPGLVDDDEIAASTEPLQHALERATVDPAAGVAAHRARTLAAQAAARAASGVPTLVEDDHPVIGGGVGDPSGSHLGAPVPRFASPAPHYDSPAPRYDSPAPRHDSPAPYHDSPVPMPASSSSTGRAAASSFAGTPEDAPDSGPRARALDTDPALAVETSPSSTDMARPRRLPLPTGAHARPGGRLLLLVAAAGMMALLGMAIMQMAFDDPGLGPDSARRAPDPSTPAAQAPAGSRPGAPQTASKRPPEPPPAPAPEPAPVVEPDAPAVVPDTPAGTGGVAHDEPSGAEDAGVPPDSPVGDPDAKPVAEPPVAEPPVAEPPTHGTTPPPPPKATGVAAKLGSAIAEDKVKVVDGDLFVLTGLPRDTTTWDTADARCRARKIDGVAGWRLPSKGQVRALKRAGVIGNGSWWTRATVGEDEVVAFDAGSGRMDQWLKIEPNARTVCVRGP